LEKNVAKNVTGPFGSTITHVYNTQNKKMAAEKAKEKLKFTSPAINLLALNYTMPANPEDLDGEHKCLPCILGGGRFNENKCTRADDTAKPVLEMSLTIHDMYHRLENDCGNSRSCSYLDLKGEWKQYEKKMFMQDKKGDYKFVYGWNAGVEKFDHCTYHVNLPEEFEGGLNMIPSGLNHTSAILAYNNNFNYDPDDWYIMDNSVMETLKKESSYKS